MYPSSCHIDSAWSLLRYYVNTGSADHCASVNTWHSNNKRNRAIRDQCFVHHYRLCASHSRRQWVVQLCLFQSKWIHSGWTVTEKAVAVTLEFGLFLRGVGFSDKSFTGRRRVYPAPISTFFISYNVAKPKLIDGIVQSLMTVVASGGDDNDATRRGVTGWRRAWPCDVRALTASRMNVASQSCSGRVELHSLCSCVASTA